MKSSDREDIGRLSMLMLPFYVHAGNTEVLQHHNVWLGLLAFGMLEYTKGFVT